MLAWCRSGGVAGSVIGGVMPYPVFTLTGGDGRRADRAGRRCRRPSRAPPPRSAGRTCERKAAPPRSAKLATLNTRRRMPFSRRVRRIVSRAAAVMLLTSMVTAGVAVHAPKALAAGTVLFNQPFHDNTLDGTAGSVSLPTAPAASGNTACLTAAGNATANPLASCPTVTDAQGSGKLRLTAEHHKSGRWGLRQHQHPHLAGPGRDLQHLPVRGHPGCGWAGLRAGGRQSRQSGHPRGHRATRRGARLLGPEFQCARPELWLPGRRFRRLRQLQQPLRGTWLQ